MEYKKPINRYYFYLCRYYRVTFSIMPFNIRLHFMAKDMKDAGTILDTVSKILQVVNSDSVNGATKNKLMYEVSLSNAQLNDYVTMLIERDLLHYDLQAHAFKITEKGLRFLKTYNQMYDMIKAQV
jgi:predicted transcriptional regulator